MRLLLVLCRKCDYWAHSRECYGLEPHFRQTGFLWSRLGWHQTRVSGFKNADNHFPTSDCFSQHVRLELPSLLAFPEPAPHVDKTGKFRPTVNWELIGLAWVVVPGVPIGHHEHTRFVVTKGPNLHLPGAFLLKRGQYLKRLTRLTGHLAGMIRNAGPRHFGRSNMGTISGTLPASFGPAFPCRA